MAAQRLRGPDAWKLAASKPNSRWFNDISRFENDLAIVVHQPKFELSLNDRFFCIGSCFARNIEEHLIYRSVNVLSKKIISPKSEFTGRVNGFINKFTTHSMHNEVGWVSSNPVVNEVFFEEVANGWQDLQLAPGVPPVTLDRAIERRTYLINDYFSRVKDSSVIVLTLGLNEVWFDTKLQKHLNCCPSYFATRREPDRYELHITDVEENVRELEQIKALISKLNPTTRFIVSV